MMKFMFSHFLFRFWKNSVYITTPIGDLYKLELTGNANNPFLLMLLRKRNYNEDIDQLQFETELRSHDMIL